MVSESSVDASTVKFYIYIINLTGMWAFNWAKYQIHAELAIMNVPRADMKALTHSPMKIQ